MKFKKLLIPTFLLVLMSNVNVKSYALLFGLDSVWNFGVEVVSKVKPEIKNDLSNFSTDMIDLKVGLALPRSIVNSLSNIFNMGYGKINESSFDKSNPLYQQFFKVAIATFLVLAVIEMIRTFYSGGDFVTYIKNFILSLTKPILYVIGISFAVILLNSFIGAFETADMAKYLNGEMDNSYQFALDRQKSSWDNKSLLNLGIDFATLPIKTYLKFSFLGIGFDLADPAKQFNFFAICSSYINLIFGLVNWFVMWVAQVFISLCFIISPLIAVLGLFENGKQMQSNFWSFFLDSCVTIFSFHFIFFFLKSTFLTLKNPSDLNLGYMIMTGAVLFLLPVIMFKFRSIFTISYYQAQSVDNNLNRGVGSAFHSTTNVVQNTTSTISSAITNSSNMWK